MKVYGVKVEGIALCPFCQDPGGTPLARKLLNTPLTRDILDTQRCGNPECDGTGEYWTTVPRCHQDAGLDTEYCKEHGTLTLVCHTCHDLVATLQVA